MEVPWKCHGNVVEVLWNYPGSAVEVPWKCHGNVVEVMWNYPGSAVEIHGSDVEVPLK